jgi:glycosyltransferase involved in cell wall biosynthesis
MKILLINKFLYPKGGDAICTLATGELLSKKGHQVAYWGTEHPDNPSYPHKEFFVDYADLVNGGSIAQQAKKAMNILYSRQAKQKIQKVIEAERPEVVHLNNFAHQISPSILHVFKKYNIPAVMTMHDYKLVCPAYSMLNNGKPCEKCKDGKYFHCLLNKCTHNSRAKSLTNTIEMYLHHRLLKIYDLVDVFISPSLYLKNKVKEMGFSREVVHLPNLVSLTDYQPKYESTQNSVVYFGRLSGEKGLFTLLNAVKKLDVQLKIVGDGPIRQELEKKVADESINNVSFLGYKTGNELKDIIRHCIATVTPSECYENNPLSVIESFAMGKPAIGAKIGGIPELVQNGITGYTFESGNADDLHAKIKTMIEDPAKITTMGHNARQHVEQNNSSEEYYRQLMKIYEKAVDNRI